MSAVRTPARAAPRPWLRLFLASPSAVTGFALVIVVVLAAVAAPLVAPFNPVQYSPIDRLQ